MDAPRRQRQRHPVPHRRGRDRPADPAAARIRPVLAQLALPAPCAGRGRVPGGRAGSAGLRRHGQDPARLRRLHPRRRRGRTGPLPRRARRGAGRSRASAAVRPSTRRSCSPARVRGVVAIAAPHPATTTRIRRPVPTDRYRPPAAVGGHTRLAGAASRRPQCGAARADRSFPVGSGLEAVRTTSPTRWRRCGRRSGSRARRVAPSSTCGGSRGSPLRTDGHRHREALATPISVPVLHIVGDADRFTPAAALAATREHCAGWYTLSTVRGVGHYPAEESPDLVSELIAQFASAAVLRTAQAAVHASVEAGDVVHQTGLHDRRGLVGGEREADVRLVDRRPEDHPEHRAVRPQQRAAGVARQDLRRAACRPHGSRSRPSRCWARGAGSSPAPARARACRGRRADSRP